MSKEPPPTNQIIVFDENFAQLEVSLPGSTVKGNDIISAAGYQPVADYVILQQLPEGTLEGIRPDEKVSLKGAGKEIFFVIRSDRLFFFTINQHKFEWPKDALTGETIRKLAGKDEDVEVIQVKADGSEIVIEDETSVQLGGTGVENFITHPARKLIEVFYNHNSVKIEKGTYTNEQLRQKFGVPDNYVLALILASGEFPPLTTGQEIKVKKGMCFISFVPQGNSA